MCLIADIHLRDSPIRKAWKAENDHGNFEVLYGPNRHVRAIPFFGRLNQAHILTLGVNPSSKEFSKGRSLRLLASECSEAHLETYLAGCINYFQGDHLHRWFSVWEDLLNSINASYYDGNCPPAHFSAHLDLSMRPTRGMASVRNQRHLFEDMLEQGAAHRITLMQYARSKRLVLAGGRVFDKCLPTFLGAKRIHAGLVADGSVAQWERWSWTIDGRDIPLFYCTSGPSALGLNPENVLEMYFGFVRDVLPIIKEDQLLAAPA